MTVASFERANELALTLHLPEVEETIAGMEDSNLLQYCLFIGVNLIILLLAGAIMSRSTRGRSWLMLALFSLFMALVGFTNTPPKGSFGLIEKCLTVKRGETESIAKSGKVPPADPKTLASGYVGTDGIAQIAGLIGLKFASEAADESEVKSAIAGILPKLIRGTITDVTWTMTKSEQGIEDKYQIGMQAGSECLH